MTIKEALGILESARLLYSSHKKNATKSKIQNLEKLWEVLEAIREDGGKDYSLAEVGRRLARIGGVATQSLRNSQGAAYREIISAYADAVKGSTRYVAKNKSNVEQALDLITDPSTRAVLRLALDDAKRLRFVNDNLRAAFKTIMVGATLVSPVAGGEGTEETRSSTGISVCMGLSPRLITALRKGIAETRLAEQGLRVSDDGGIISEAGDKIFPPSFVTAVRAILADAAVRDEHAPTQKLPER